MDLRAMEENGSSREGVRSAMAAASARLFFFDSLPEDPPQHFLDACFLCKTPIGGNRDIFMYRGDTPFCSEECRQEQIDIDEAREKTLAMSVKAAASSRKAAQGIEVSSAGAVLAV